MTRLQQQNTTYLIHSFRYSTKNKGQLIQWISTHGHWSIEVRVLVQNVWISFFETPHDSKLRARAAELLLVLVLYHPVQGQKGTKFQHVTGQKCFISFYHRFGIYLPKDAPTRMMKHVLGIPGSSPTQPVICHDGVGSGIFCSLKAGAACAKAWPFSCKATCCRLLVFWENWIQKRWNSHFCTWK